MSTHSGRPGRGSQVLMWLMGCSLILLIALTWHSLRSAQTHLAAAEAVLEDYARLAAEEYARKAKGAVGFWVLHRIGSLVASPAAGRIERIQSMRAAPAGEMREQEVAALNTISTMFEYHPEIPSLTPLLGEIDASRAALLLAVLADVSSDDSDQNPFHVRHWALDGTLQTTVVYPLPVGPWIGMELSPAELANWFESVFQREPLLPPTLAGDSGNSIIYLRLRDREGATLFESSAGYDPYLMADVVIGDDYGGLFRDFTVRASIDPALAPALVIGGLPRSRLPILLLLIGLTVAVLMATFWLVLRDRALSRMRAQFVARVSHELRTPLTQIRLFAETLLLGRVSQEDKRREYLAIINREALRLGHLVDNVLAFSGREKSPQSLVLETTRLDQLLEEVVDGYAPLATTQGNALDLQTESDLTGRFDREAFRQILLNLLDNACKYGPDGQTVRTRAWRAEARLWVAVEDDGPGIPDNEKRAIWLPYRRLQREDRRAVNGAGIGLSVARDLIEAMGGDYRVEDARGGGARFVISFPENEPR